jgi:hypothetical protein
MDFLSHLFLPLTAAYVIRPEVFDSPWALGLAGFGLLADLDKFLGTPGLLHSLVTVGPICGAVLLVEYWWRDRLVWSPVIVALIGSHLVLDLLDGGPVPLLFPLIKTGIGLEYPVQTVFGQGPVGLQFEGHLVGLRTTAPRPGYNSYGFIQGTGVASLLLFVLIYVTDHWGGRADARPRSRHPTGRSSAETGPENETSIRE